MAKNPSESDHISDVVVVKASLVTPLLTCELCGGLYKEATTVKHCLHVFCRSCLYKDFATNKRGSNKCPSKVRGVGVHFCIYIGKEVGFWGCIVGTNGGGSGVAVVYGV